MIPDDLRAWADLSEAAGYEHLTRHPPGGRAAASRRFGGSVAFATGRSAGFFNPILILEPASPADLREAVGWMRERESAFTLRIREDLESDPMRATATELGLERDAWVEPAMVLVPLHAGPQPPAGLSIEAADTASMERFYQALAEMAGGGPVAEALLRDIYPLDLVADPDVRVFGGFLDGEPIACSSAIRSGPVVGVYSVGTAARARGRGIGTAMTWRAIEAGLEWGCEAATLQASAMGEPVYRAMGFRTVTRYATWSEVVPSGGG